MSPDLKKKFSTIMYFLTKTAARDSLKDFLEYADLTDEEWDAIKAHLKAEYGVETYA